MSTLPQKNRAEEREDRERSRKISGEGKGQKERESAERKRTKGKGKSCLNESTESPGDRKANLPNMVTLKQEVQLVACHP